MSDMEISALHKKLASRPRSVIRGRGPFRPDPVGGHGLNRDIGGNFVFQCARIHVLTPLPVVVQAFAARPASETGCRWLSSEPMT